MLSNKLNVSEEKMYHEFPEFEDELIDCLGIKLDGDTGVKKTNKLDCLKSCDYLLLSEDKTYSIGCIEFSDLSKQLEDIDKFFKEKISKKKIPELLKYLYLMQDINITDKQINKFKLKCIKNEFLSKIKDTLLILKLLEINFNKKFNFIIVSVIGNDRDNEILLDRIITDLNSDLIQLSVTVTQLSVENHKDCENQINKHIFSLRT